MKLAVYPGCSLNGSAREYYESVSMVLEKLNIEYSEVPDWNCCGATAAHNLNKDLSVVLPSKIIASAENNGNEELLVPCAACFNRLKSVQKKISEHPDIKEKVSAFLEQKISATIRIRNIVEFISPKILQKKEEEIVKPFQKKVACYYGCLLVRPHEVVEFDREEDPQFMEKIMVKIGAEPIDWAYKTECCGAGFTISNSEIVAKLSAKILEDAVDRGAEMLIVACPMCHANLDMRRPMIEKILKKEIKIPVLYITQAIGLALGIEAGKLGIRRHFVPVSNC
jgi:heterodisulfide reductase subunit B2